MEAPWDARCGGEGRQPSAEESQRLHGGQVLLIGFLQPLTDRAGIERLAAQGRARLRDGVDPAHHTRAADGCALLAGDGLRLKAVLLAADRLPRFFPMLMTAAGTVTPAKRARRRRGRRPAGDRHRASPRRRRLRVRRASGRPRAGRVPRCDVPRLGVVGEETAGGYARELTADQQRRQQAALAERVPTSTS